ncbi:uncharacterized protein LOC124694413 [Lolium rigidum]|uniref:uncharacterized protein LOC124694413 n=1 Tax=Lolium rigidum TaxID=89674 RepID=UPI001F5E3339|nr:uncharacterized protein LOC124694413 [Lolium rigidum]
MDDGSFPRTHLGGGGRRRLVVRAFYLRMSSSCSFAGQPPEELTLVYHPAIGGAALEVAGRALPPASAVHVPLLRVRGAHGDAGKAKEAAAYASADRVSAAEGARFAVFAGRELAADGVFVRRAEGGWRVECRRALASRARVAEVVVLAEGGVLVRARAKASIGCLTRLEGIPEEEACGCGACGEEEWEVVGDDDGSDSGDEYWKCKEREEAAEMETVRWALEMGAWAVCVGVGLLATARRFSRKRPLR